ncbi:hypothetical protein DB346_16850 [Verrucomicrobia bacterium LW23]|nr:hypothetical protein DB346_16850 [Verrucomicrobia bacterium LW23]
MIHPTFLRFSPRAALFVCGRQTKTGFTLVELLTVMAVASIIITLSSMGIGNMMRSLKVSAGSSVVIDTFVLARQAAVSSNKAVEVRFYKMTGAEGDRFKAIRMVAIDDQGNEKPLNMLQRLPAELEMAESSTYSTLLDASTAPRSGTETVSEGSSLAYVGFRFKPNGLTDLKPDEQWYLTVQPTQTSGTALASNYFTVQVNPATGAATLYRP